MDLGEKLTVLSDRVYRYAETEMKICGVSPTLAALIMENVNGRFQAAAYRTINNVRAAEEEEMERRAAEEETIKRSQEQENVETDIIKED